MAIEPTKRISETPVIRREDNSASQRKKPRPQKKEEKDGRRSVDIRV